jgi:hypothetical protein
MGGMCIEFQMVSIKKEILTIAINKWDRKFRKVGTQGSVPKVKAAMSSFVEKLESMTKSVVVVFMRAGG